MKYIISVLSGLILLTITTAHAATAALGASSLLEGPTGGNDSVALAVTPSTATWTATTNATWLHLSPENQSGTGGTNVIFSFDTNTGATRSSTLTIAGQTLTVTQAGTTFAPVLFGGEVANLGLQSPSGLGVDGAGNVYIADSGDNAIKEWMVASGTLTTLVSSGLNTPEGVAVDGSGNVYIADSGDYAFKEWTLGSSNLVTLFSVAHGGMPLGVAVDSMGNVYAADTALNAIREWNPATSNLTALVSSGLSNPGGVAVDLSGDVYISDTGFGNIKERVEANSNVVNLVPSGLSNPMAVAVDGSGNVYIADSGDNAIKEWNAANKSVITLVPSSTGLNHPEGVAVDASGNIYYSDTDNEAIDELPRAFVDTTPISLGAAYSSGSFSPVMPTTANLVDSYLPSFNSILDPIDDQPWLVVTGATNGVVSYTVAANGTSSPRMGYISVLGQSIFVTQAGASVLATNAILGTTNILEGPPGEGDSVELVVTPITGAWTATANADWLHLSLTNQSGDGNATVAFTFDANTGPTRTGTLRIAGQTITVTQAGSGYVPADQFGVLVSAGLNQPFKLVLDAAGDLYISDTDDNAIIKWTAASNTVTTLVSSGLSYPFGLALDSAGNVYIADNGNKAIKKWNATNNTVSTLVSGLNEPADVVVDAADNVYFTDPANHTFEEWIAASSNVVTLASGMNNDYHGLTMDFEGNIYIVDNTYTGSTVQERVAATGNLVTVGPTPGYNVAVDGSGNLYLGTSSVNVDKRTVATGTLTTIADEGNSYDGIAVDGARNVFVADITDNEIKELPYAFVVTAPLMEGSTAGINALPPVLPTNANLTGPFLPTSDQPWLVITGVTNGVVSFSFADNGPAIRTAHINLLGQPIVITQAAAPVAATNSVLGTTVILEGPASGSDSVVLGVMPQIGAWTARANAAWLHLNVANQGGAGSQNVIFSFDTNTGLTRSGTLTIAGQTLTITQAGSTYAAANAAVPLVTSGLWQPSDLAADTAGNVYISDTQDWAVKEWTVANETVNPLVSSGLTYPFGVAVDSSGNLYIADSGHEAIKEWNVTNNTVSTLVAGLNDPQGVAVDSMGNVYIADTGNNAIEEWSAASNTVSTLVFLGGGSHSMTDVAVDAAGNVYFSSDELIQELNVADNTFTTLVPSKLYGSQSVAVDGEGNVYIADILNSAVKKWTAISNSVTTLESSLTTYPEAATVDSAGNVYYVAITNGDYTSNNAAVFEIPHAFVDTTTKWESPAASSDLLAAPLPATVNLAALPPTSDQSWLTITGTTNDVVSYSFATNTGASTRTAHITVLGQAITVNQFGQAAEQNGPLFILGLTTALEGPAEGIDSVTLAASPNYLSWAANANAAWLHLNPANQFGTGGTNVVFNFDANPGATRVGTLTIAGQTLTVTQAGTNYIAASQALVLRTAGLDSPFDMAPDSTGNLYITVGANAQLNGLIKLTTVSNKLATLVSSGLAQPTDLSLDGAGNVYLVDSQNNAIKEWNATSGVVTTLVPGLNSPGDLVVDPAGDVFFTDYNASALEEWIASSSKVVNLATNTQNNFNGLTLDVAGNIYIANEDGQEVQEWVAANSNIVTVLASVPRYPGSVVVDGSGNLYINSDTVYKWTAGTGTLAPFAPSGLDGGSVTAVDGARNVFIVNRANDDIEELPYAFVDPTPKLEGLGAGTDTLSPVLPAVAIQPEVLAAKSDQSWLTITGVTNGAVSFSFSDDTGAPARTARITMLGQSIPITQGVVGVPTMLTDVHKVQLGRFVFAFTNIPSASFTILFTTNLLLPLNEWSVAGTAIEGPPGQYTYTNTYLTNAQRFYSIRSP